MPRTKQVSPVAASDDELYLVAEMQAAPEEDREYVVSWSQVLAGGVLLGLIAGLAYLFWTRV